MGQVRSFTFIQFMMYSEASVGLDEQLDQAAALSEPVCASVLEGFVSEWEPLQAGS